MKIAIYSRKSIFTGKGESIENQIELCKNYCETYLNDKKLEYIVYEDEGFSGKNTNRPKFKELIDHIKLKKIDVLICYRLDRISRNVADFSSTLELLQKYNVTFISIKEQFDTSTPMGRAMIYIASVFAQLERETIAERVKDNMLQLAKMGKWSGGQLPLGYSSEKVNYMNEEMKEKTYSKLIPLDEELAIVKSIYKNYLLKNSIREITKELNENKFRSKNGYKFDLMQIRRILRNPLYVKSSKETHAYLSSINYNVFGTPNGNGYLTYNKRTDKDNLIVAVSAHTGIISSYDWLQTQKILDNNKEKIAARAGTGCNNTLFSGLLKCGKCGANMVIKYNAKNKNGDSYIYYVCSNKQTRHSENKCDCPNLRTDLIDPIIIKDIKTYNAETIIELYNERLKELSTDDDRDIISNLQSQLSKKESQVHNLVVQMSNTSDQSVSKLLMDQITSLSNEMNNLKEKIQNEDNTKKYIQDEISNIKILKDSYLKFNENFDNTDDINIKRNLIRSIVESVVYDPENETFEVTPLGLKNMHFDNTSKSLDCNLYTSKR